MRQREHISPEPSRSTTVFVARRSFRQRRPKVFSLMIEPRPSVTRFVTAVVRAELARGGAHDSDVAQRILTRLCQALGPLIGPAGFDVLLARSLVFTRRAHPVLAGITAGPGGTITGLDEAARASIAGQESAIAIVSHFSELLVMLIGEDLAMRLLHNVWPGVEEEKK
jgi:hypothetical protein